MDLRALGKNGPKVHPVAIGAMSFSDFYGPTTEANSFAVLDAALDAGVNHIDTANVYGMGRSEETIGAYLRKNPSAKDHFVIATKAAITRKDGARFFDNDPAHLEAELDKSLSRMGIEAVDLFYVHRREQDRPVEEVAEALGELVRKGKTKSIGFSEIAPTTLRRANAAYPVAAVQSEYSLQTRVPELGLLQTCEELGVAMVAFSPVGRSYLTDDPQSFDAIQGLGFMKANPRFSADNYPRNIAATDKLRSMAADMGVSTAGLANAWVFAKSTNTISIPGTRSAAHFKEYLDAERISLSAADMDAIEAILPVGWCHGDRYNADQWVGPECYC